MADTKVRLILEGNLVTREEIVEEKIGDGGSRVTTTSQTKPLAAVMDELAKLNPRMDFAPALKFGRWVASITNGNKTAVAVELPPGVRVFNYRPAVAHRNASYRETPSRMYQLAFPYTILVVHLEGNKIGSIWVYYSNKPICSPANELCHSNLPNIYKGRRDVNDRMCTGDWAVLESLNLREKVETIIQEFLDSEFNRDLEENFWLPAIGKDSDGNDTEQTVPGHPKSFEEWHKRSAEDEDPEFILKLDWVKAGVTLEQKLREGVE